MLNNNMDMPMASVHDASGRCSPIGGGNDAKISFGFTQEQVECVCEVISIDRHNSLNIFVKPTFSTCCPLFRFYSIRVTLSDWAVFSGLCRHAINSSSMNRFSKPKHLLHSNVANSRNYTIYWSIINSHRTITINCSNCG